MFSGRPFMGALKFRNVQRLFIKIHDQRYFRNIPFVKPETGNPLFGWPPAQMACPLAKTVGKFGGLSFSFGMQSAKGLF